MSSSLNVLVVASGYPPEHSGSGRRLHEIYRRLATRHRHLAWRVLTRRRQPGVPAPDGPTTVDAVEAIPGRHGNLGPGLALTEWREARRRVRDGLLNDVHIVHTVGFTWLAAHLCREAGRRGVPVVRELTSMADTGMGRGLGGRVFAAVTRRMNRCADLLVAISPRIQREVRESGVLTPIWCRPNPVNTDRFRPASESERVRLRKQLAGPGWPEDAVVALHVGHIRPNKNQLLLVQALERLPDHYRLVLIGPAYPEDQQYLDLLQAQIKDRQLTERVLLLPTQRDDVERYMRAADLFVFPSEREGLGNVMLEALCSGLPVVANHIPGVTDWIIEPGRNGFLASPSAADLANRMAAVNTHLFDSADIARSSAERFGAPAIDALYWEHLTSLAATGNISQSTRMHQL